MEDYLMYLVLGVFYLIYSVLTSKKKKKQRAARPAGPPLPGPVGGPVGDPVEASPAEPTMDDALREIRVMLGMEAPPPPPIPSPPRAEPLPIEARPRTVAPPTRTHGPGVAETAPQKSWPSEFKPIPTHYADETFEERPTWDGDRFGQRRQKPKPPPARPSTLKQLPTDVRRSRLSQQLKDPKTAQEAFILSEIFGPPHAHRRR